MSKKYPVLVCYLVEEILPDIRSIIDQERYFKKEYADLPSGNKVKITRALRCFSLNGPICASCGLVANVFEEVHDIRHGCYFLRLYHISKDERIPFGGDHIAPKSLGGSGGVVNQQTMCQPCNNNKGDSINHSCIELYRLASVKDALMRRYGRDHPRFSIFYADYVELMYCQVQDCRFVGYVTRAELNDFIHKIKTKYSLNVFEEDIHGTFFPEVNLLPGEASVIYNDKWKF